jgi:iron(III) transport system substrate-binding protein
VTRVGRRGAVVGGLAVSLLSLSCGGRSESTSSGSDATTPSVVVYCSADKEFAEPIFRAYESKSGVKVLPLYDTEETKTAGLTARLIAEKAQPKADVFWSSDTSRAVALVDQGLAAAYAPHTAETIPDRYKGANGSWTGFGARIRVMLYNTEKVKPADVPRSILDLAQPRWKGRVAIANPHFGTMSFHASALFAKWGEAKASEFLRRLKDNDVVITAGNSDVKDRVADGRVDVGIMDEDDAVVAIRDGKPVAIAILDQVGADALGTPLMPNVALLVQGAPHPDQARRFIDFLVSADAETILAESNAAQYPLHPLSQIRVMEVDYLDVSRRLPAMDAAVLSIFGR